MKCSNSGRCALADIAAELNRFLDPERLEEADGFDEVPGFIADHCDSERFVLQGVPLDLPLDAPSPEWHNYFYFRCAASDVDTLPPSLPDLPRDAAIGQKGYWTVNE
ncbi:hypothetical protein [Kinneretia aquatilis]|uniref:hypothetical protein n=1 Tax=Kinneretia aquatilis TaxID=2070761 RepID=UPI0010574A68|nr:hypothetical protein [Paucibacter aquatile]